MKEYTQDWTTANFEIWKIALKHFIDMPVRILEIGSFEGRSTCWFAENILTHDQAQILCVDPWDYEENPYIEQFDMSTAKKNFMQNVSEYGAKVQTLQGYSTKVLCGLIAGKYTKDPVTFHAIYIDGDHDTLPVLRDTVLCWELLAPGGIMIFDDYGSGDQNTPLNKLPKIAIDSFLATVHGRYNVAHAGYQMIIQKKQ